MNRLTVWAVGATLLSAMGTTGAAESYGPRYDLAVKYFMSPEEPRVKDALWTSPKILKLGVIDDGSSRDGYAEYACQVLAERGFKGQGVSVQIIDIVQVTRKGKWVRLGRADCP